MTPTYPVTIPFRTGRAAEGPLIWGQLAIWNVLRWLPPDDTTLNLLVEVPVPPGRDLPAVLDALRTLVERHDSLHTVYLDGPLQRVLPEGEVPLAVHELGDRGLTEAAAELGEALRVGWFDMAADLPLRAAVLVRDGVPQTVLLAASHMAVDGWSFAIVRGDLANLLADPPVVVEPRQQPVERGEYERSAVGQRRAAKALQYWEKHLATIPPSMIGSIRDGRPPNLDWGLIQSPALALAVNDLAARHGVPPATALLGATALQLAAYTGEGEAALRTIVSTRFRPASRGVVAAFNQNALFRLPVTGGLSAPSGGETVGQLLRRSADAALTAYAHCEYDPRDLDAMFVDVAARRGITPDGYCFFNDTRYTLADRSTMPEALPQAELAERIQAALPATKLRSPVIDRLPMHSNFFMFLMDLGDTAELMLCVEHGFLGRRGPLGFLAGLEGLVVRAALDDQVTTGALYAAAR
ncbi:condensation domain-containing protein [Dactylosporangium sp. AC04546]|uniref:condensation domain-containing protein n=1 Tax=Dactylosporangium sp. AC04546 TaxID=2862460 RepID=UPI001EDE93AD|nr:condensation domain-containing protein [Dactylosporangium sp. AC04546]WVK86095.1 condensation domain-containing protein [Dactylosporangium sp. AC04546]